MKLPAIIESSMEQNGIAYHLHTHPSIPSLGEAARVCGIPEEHVVRGVLLEDHLGVLLAVLPLNHSIDFYAVSRVTGRDMLPAKSETIEKFFTGCENGTVPPLALPFRITGLIDESLYKLPQICFEPGDRSLLICMETEDFFKFNTKSQIAPFSTPLQTLITDSTLFVSNQGAEKLQQLRPLGNIADRIRTLKDLPDIPPLVSHLLRIRNQSESTVEELSAIIAQDPPLCAQLVRHARSSHFKDKHRAESLGDAITNVLGYDVALHMALGLAVCQYFSNTVEGGPIGRHAFWRHAVFTATLAESLARLLPAHLGITPGTAFLSGLLHNIGYLVMGKMLQPEFYLLNRVVDANPDVPITLIEKRLLGIGHTHVGAWLMRSWQMPEEIITTVREHHNEVHSGTHSHYVHLMIVADSLLKSHGIGEGTNSSIPPGSLNHLGLDPRRAKEITGQLIDHAEGLNGLANQLCA